MQRNDQNLATGIAFPLVVDLDGTLTPSNTLLEAICLLVKQSPTKLARALGCLTKGRAAFKDYVVANTSFSATKLPYRENLLEYLRKEKGKGRQLVLATASHRTVADLVSEHLGIFDDVIATSSTNLKGRRKLEAIRSKLGEDFVYAGDSSADLPVWEAAKGAVLVGASTATTKIVGRTTPLEAQFPQASFGLKRWAIALRLHQWLKNLLIFVPLLTSFSFFDSEKIIISLLAFFSFSFAASATYLVNDLWDLQTDRAHPRKRLRPLALAEISIVSALTVAGVLIALALLLAFVISTPFLTIIGSYLLITTSYSWFLKRYVILDVIVLSVLYTLRILAGAAAIMVTTSTWLLAFSVFIFLSLALVKRCAELVSIEQSGGKATSGRNYRVGDLVVLWPLGVGAAMSAVVIFGLFINAPETVARYQSPLLLWLVALGLVYWLSRLWIKTARGEMEDDPVIYALMDRSSQVIVVSMIAAILGAYLISWEAFYG